MKFNQAIASMTLEENMRSYLAKFDGTVRDFSDVEGLFDSMFDDQFKQMDGDTLSKEQLKTIHANCFSLGSTASGVKVQMLAPQIFAFRFRIVNARADAVIHFVCQVSYTGKILTAKATEESVKSLLRARRAMAHYDVERKFKAHLAVYDGTVKTYDEMEAPFEAAIHPNFGNRLSGKTISKAGMFMLILASL